jgi:hypothetical protein
VKTRRWIIASVIGVLVTLPTAVASASEDAGSLVVSPASGDVQTPIDLYTVGMCERGTSYMVTIRGKGISGIDDDDIIVGASDLKWLDPTGYPSHMVSTSVSLERFFQRASVGKPRGDYTLTFICRNRLDVDVLQSFEATITIDAKGGYQAQGVSALDIETAVEQADVDYVTVPGSDEVELIDPDAVDADAIDAEGMAQESTVVSNTGSDSLRGILLAAGALLLVGAASAWIVIRRREDQDTRA